MSNKIEKWAYNIDTWRILAADYYVEQHLSEIGYSTLEEAITELDELAKTDLRRFPGDLYIILQKETDTSKDMQGFSLLKSYLRFETYESWKTHLKDDQSRKAIRNPLNIKTPNLDYYSGLVMNPISECSKVIMVVPESYKIFPHWRTS